MQTSANAEAVVILSAVRAAAERMTHLPAGLYPSMDLHVEMPVLRALAEELRTPAVRLGLIIGDTRQLWAVYSAHVGVRFAMLASEAVASEDRSAA